MYPHTSPNGVENKKYLKPLRVLTKQKSNQTKPNSSPPKEPFWKIGEIQIPRHPRPSPDSRDEVNRQVYTLPKAKPHWSESPKKPIPQTHLPKWFVFFSECEKKRLVSRRFQVGRSGLQGGLYVGNFFEKHSVIHHKLPKINLKPT